MATINTSPNYDGPEDTDNDFMCAAQLQRIATSLEEILKLVKQDQEESKKRLYDEVVKAENQDD